MGNCEARCADSCGQANQQIVHEFTKESTLSHEQSVAVLEQGDAEDNLMENITITNVAPTTEDLKIILTVFEKHFMMSEMPIAQRLEVASKLRKAYAKSNELIFKEGDLASAYFIVEDGVVEISIGGKSRKRVVKGEAFGDLALLYGVKRSATVQAISDCTFWVIDRNTFKKAAAEFNERVDQINRKLIEELELFEFLTAKNKMLLLGGIRECSFYKETIIIDSQDPAENLYIIKKGCVRVKETTKQDAVPKLSVMTAGKYFGEKVLTKHTPQQVASYGVTVTAESDCQIIMIPRCTLEEVVGQRIDLLRYHDLIRGAFEKIVDKKSNFLQFDKKANDAYQISFESCECVSFGKGDVLMTKHCRVDRVMVCLTQVKVNYGGSHQSFAPGKILLMDQLFKTRGSMQDIEENSGEDFYRYTRHEVTSQCQGKAVVFLFKPVIGKVKRKTTKFQGVDGQQAQERGRSNKPKSGTNYYQTTADLGKLEKSKTGMHKSRSRNNNSPSNQNISPVQLTPESLIVVNKVSFGEFGETYICEQPIGKTLYSVKVLEKEMIDKRKIWKLVKNQIEALEKIKSPWMLTYYTTFKDSHNYYIVTELVKGRDLADFIKETGTLEHQMASIFTAQILLALEYLHSRHIIHRSIKPENIYVGRDGYLKLMNMSTAKVLKKADHFKTKTVVGTPNYMAPEVLLGRGYTFYADLWSVGICLYEFVCGKLPFKEQTQDPFQIYQAILRRKPSFPANLKAHLHLQNLILRLLSTQPAARFGGNFDSLKTHSFFRDLDWCKLEQKSLGQELLYVPRATTRKGSKNITKSTEEQFCIQEYFQNRYQEIKKKTNAIKGTNPAKQIHKVYEWEALIANSS